ncbi:MAG: hypothetical protein HOP13_14170 [Alphaproteobacteria bacterium]|nr:hypothetical protein [Alphaproteobacteria bacterium]
MSDTKQIKCARCKVTLEGPTDAKGQDVFACPICGNADNLENIHRELANYMQEHAATSLQNSMRKSFANNKFIKYKPGIIHKRTYRFMVDLDF